MNLYAGLRGRFHRFMPLFYFKQFEWKNPHFFISQEELLEKKSSNTVFILGSGSSINDIPASQWKEIAKHDTLAFNFFFKGKFVPIDFHIIREMGCRKRALDLKPGTEVREYVEGIKSNPCYKDTVFFVNRNVYPPITMLAHDLLNASFFPYSNGKSGKNFNEIQHSCTLLDAINIAYLMGYGKIVLAGVDLYDSRYFWLQENEVLLRAKEMGQKPSDEHRTLRLGIIEQVKQWNDFLKKEGVELRVLNPRSLLSLEAEKE